VLLDEHDLQLPILDGLDAVTDDGERHENCPNRQKRRCTRVVTGGEYGDGTSRNEPNPNHQNGELHRP